MSRPLLVLVSGPPGAGKTTIAGLLAVRLGLPLVAKDDIKESLSDSLNRTSLLWSKRLGAATWDLMFVLLRRFVAAGASAIFESNFYPDSHRAVLEEILEGTAFIVYEVHCTADPQILAERNATRERHVVHHSRTPTATAMRVWAANNSALELSQHVERLDTGAANPFDLDELVSRIKGVADGL